MAANPSSSAMPHQVQQNGGLNYFNAKSNPVPRPRYAHLVLEPATQQTVVTTTTTTTIHYAPIRIPRPISPTLSGDYGSDKIAFPLSLASTASSTSEGQREILIRLGEERLKATYAMETDIKKKESSSSHTTEVKLVDAAIDRKGKRRMRTEQQTTLEDEYRQRLGVYPMLQEASSYPGHLPSCSSSPSSTSYIPLQPPLKKSRLDNDQPIYHDNVSNNGAVLNLQIDSIRAPSSSSLRVPVKGRDTLAVLPSPNLSPRIPTDNLDDYPSIDKSLELDPREDHPRSTSDATQLKEVERNARVAMKEEFRHADQKELSLGDGYELTTLLSLRSLVSEFSALPSQLQTHVLYNLLRHSSVSVLQSVNHLIQPALKRDFVSDLPAELSIQVLSYLDSQSIMRCITVSKNWKRFIDAQGEIWSGLLKAEDLWIGDTFKTEDRECELIETLGATRKNGREIGSRELLAMENERTHMFLKRWREGVWDENFDSALEAKPTQVKIDAAQSRESKTDSAGSAFTTTSPSRPSILNSNRLRHSNTRPQISRSSAARTIQPVCTSLAESGNAPNPRLRNYIHPLKLLYKKRFSVRNHWYKPQMPHRTTFPGQHSSVVTCLQFDNDKIVTASDDPIIDVYDTVSGRLLNRLEGHEGGVWALQYVGNVLVTGSTDRTLRVWDLDTGNCTHVFYGHTSTVRCLQILEPVNVNPDPHSIPVWEPPYPLIVSGSRDSNLRIWRLSLPTKTNSLLPYVPPSPSDENTNPKENPYHLRLLKGHSLAVRALAAYGRTLVSGSYDMNLRVWDVLSGECRFELCGHTAKVYSVILDYERKQCASGSMDGTVRLWSTETGNPLYRLDGHSSLVGLLGLSYHYLVSAGADSTLKVWDPASGTCIDTLAANAGAITCFKHDDFRVVSGSEGQLRIWDIRKGKAIRDVMDTMTGVWQVQFSDRFCIAAVQREGQTDFEILDFFPELRSEEPEDCENEENVNEVWSQYDGNDDRGNYLATPFNPATPPPPVSTHHFGIVGGPPSLTIPTSPRIHASTHLQGANSLQSGLIPPVQAIDPSTVDTTNSETEPPKHVEMPPPNMQIDVSSDSKDADANTVNREAEGPAILSSAQSSSNPAAATSNGPTGQRSDRVRYWREAKESANSRRL